MEDNPLTYNEFLETKMHVLLDNVPLFQQYQAYLISWYGEKIINLSYDYVRDSKR